MPRNDRPGAGELQAERRAERNAQMKQASDTATRAESPAGKRLSELQLRAKEQGRKGPTKLGWGTPFSAVQSHRLGVYAGGTIISHLPKSKAQRGR